MVIENVTMPSIIDALANLPGVGMLVKILSGVGIVVFIYFIFLIIRIIAQRKHNKNIERLAQNVELINKKMNILIGKKIKR